MTEDELCTMYGGIPLGFFRVHDWRNDIVTQGQVPGDFLSKVSESKVDYNWPVQERLYSPEYLI